MNDKSLSILTVMDAVDLTPSEKASILQLSLINLSKSIKLPKEDFRKMVLTTVELYEGGERSE